MPDFKCAACRSRLRSPGDLAGEPCPRCEAPLEPVAELSEILGFRWIGPGGSPVDDRPAERVAAEVGDLAERRERWLDDGGSFESEALT